VCGVVEGTGNTFYMGLCKRHDFRKRSGRKGRIERKKLEQKERKVSYVYTGCSCTGCLMRNLPHFNRTFVWLN
jgi:hypothetical protein